MKDTTDVLELLSSQHDEVDALIGQIEDSDDAEEKARLFNELADKLAAHATIEERIFYPSVMTDSTHELLLESAEEHLQMKRILADMLAMDVADEHFDAKLSVLKEEVRHHARDEEEDTLFPKVRRAFSADDLAAIGNECLSMFEELIGRQPRINIAAETARAAPLELQF